MCETIGSVLDSNAEIIALARIAYYWDVRATPNTVLETQLQ
jgi:hypothetical protein